MKTLNKRYPLIDAVNLAIISHLESQNRSFHVSSFNIGSVRIKQNYCASLLKKSTPCGRVKRYTTDPLAEPKGDEIHE